MVFNTVSQLFGKAISGGITFIISLLLAKTLGVEGYGDFTKITTYVAFFYLFCDLGLNAAFLQLSKDEKLIHMKSSLFTVRLLLGLLLMFITLIILVFLPGSATQGYTQFVKMGIIIFIPSILFQALISTTNAIFQEHLRYDLATYALCAGSIGTLILVWLSIFLLSPNVLLFAIIAAFLIGSFMTAGLSYVLIKKVTKLPVIFWDPKSVKQLLKAAAPLALTLIFNVVYFYANTFILTITQSTLDVGIYGLAYKFFEFTLVIPTFFMNAALPTLIESYVKKDMMVFRKRILLSAIALTGVAVGVAILGWIFTPLLALIRPGFAASILPLRLLITGLPIFYLTSITMWILVVTKKQKELIGIYGITMVLNIALSLLCTPTYSYMAAVWITIGTECFVLASSVAVIIKSGIFRLQLDTKK